MSRDRGNLTWARREWRDRTRRAVAREQGRCVLCGKKDKSGLLDSKCTSCFVDVQNAIVQPPPAAPLSYLLLSASGEATRGPVVLPEEHLMQTACNLLNVDFMSQLATLTSEDGYVAFALANATDYALPNLPASHELARTTGQDWSGKRLPYGPVLLLTRAMPPQ